MTLHWIRSIQTTTIGGEVLKQRAEPLMGILAVYLSWRVWLWGGGQGVRSHQNIGWWRTRTWNQPMEEGQEGESFFVKKPI